MSAGTVNLVLDKRVIKKKGLYNLSIRVCHKETTMFIPLTKMSEKDYQTIFEKKSMTPEHIEFRQTYNGFLEKAERVLGDIQVFTIERFRNQWTEKMGIKDQPKESLFLKELFPRYVNEAVRKQGTKDHYLYTGRAFVKYKPGITVLDVTPNFLKKFQQDKLKTCSQPTIDGFNRDLKRIINYFTHEVKIIPSHYRYPYGKGKYVIGSHAPKKRVLKQVEIQRVMDFVDYENDTQRFAMALWKTLYYAGGMNFADLIRLKESQLSDTSLIFTRMKTELTRIKHVTDISIPMTEALKNNIEILKFFKDNPIPGFGFMKDSPYLLGLLPDNYSEQEHKNKRHKVRNLIRQELIEVSKKLNLSVPLQLKSARDCFATTLFRAGVSLEIIGSFLGHGSVIVTANYIGSLDIEDSTDAFSKLVF